MRAIIVALLHSFLQKTLKGAGFLQVLKVAWRRGQLHDLAAVKIVNVDLVELPQAAIRIQGKRPVLAHLLLPRQTSSPCADCSIRLRKCWQMPTALNQPIGKTLHTTQHMRPGCPHAH